MPLCTSSLGYFPLSTGGELPRFQCCFYCYAARQFYFDISFTGRDGAVARNEVVEGMRAAVRMTETETK